MVLAFDFDDDPVFGHLFLDQDDFFNALHNEVAPGIVGALLGLVGQLRVRQLRQPAIGRTKHHGHVPQEYIAFDIDLIALSVLHVYMDWR